MLMRILAIIQVIMVPAAFTVFTLCVSSTNEWAHYEKHPEEYDDFFKPIWEDAEYETCETESEY